MSNLIEGKSFEFAVRIVKLNRYLNAHIKEFVLSKQVLRSGTSIGANMPKRCKRKAMPVLFQK